MITSQDILAEIKHEIHIIKHLATKILPDTEQFKPTDKQRTILELLQYLSHIGASMSKLIQTGAMEHFKDDSEQAKHITLDKFEHAMFEQEQIIQDTIESIEDDSEREDTVPFFGGNNVTKKYILLFLLRTLAAYRMQLFLYIKQSGNHDIGTMNARMGQDAPQQ
jgi:hypothetical protein